MGYNVGEAHPEREGGKLLSYRKGRNFNQLPVSSRLIFLADHLASRHKEGNELPFDDFEFLVFEDFCSPQFWGVVMRGGYAERGKPFNSSQKRPS